MTLKREQEHESAKQLKAAALGNGNGVVKSDEEIQQALSETEAMWKTYESAKEKRSHEIELQRRFNRRMFDTLYNLKDAFQTADKDNSGFIEKGELKDVLKDVMGISAGTPPPPLPLPPPLLSLHFSLHSLQLTSPCGVLLLCR
jgi:hypothetical protein